MEHMYEMENIMKTDPNWRTLHKMTHYDLYYAVTNNEYYDDDGPLVIRLKNIYLLFENDIFRIM